ncbi:hypothetical protein B0H14DRAFT_1121325 [Mycena olivaceomarginata]|nr:hypothetical protein B0H14DRAFT_1121325 [Mycena olivaceomarginata]
MMKVIKGQQPERPSGPPAMSDILWRHVTEFWSDTPSTRPTTQIVVQNMLWPSPELKPKHPLPAVLETLLSVPSFSNETALPPRKHSNIDNGVGQFRVIRQGHVSIRANSTFASRFWQNKWLVLTEIDLTLHKSEKSSSPIQHLIMLDDIVKVERTDLKLYCCCLKHMTGSGTSYLSRATMSCMTGKMTFTPAPRSLVLPTQSTLYTKCTSTMKLAQPYLGAYLLNG